MSQSWNEFVIGPFISNNFRIWLCNDGCYRGREERK